jgi:hypothetical protein
MRDVRHLGRFLPELPLDIAIVRESIHKRNENEATLPAHAPAEAATALHRHPATSYSLYRATD